MKFLLTILFLLSTLAFGIDKKTPTGGTVKDKPGKEQDSGIGREIISTFKAITLNCDSDFTKTLTTLTLPKGNWEVSYSIARNGTSIGYARSAVNLTSNDSNYNSIWGISNGKYNENHTVNGVIDTMTSLPGRVVVQSSPLLLTLRDWSGCSNVTAYGTLRAIQVP